MAHRASPGRALAVRLVLASLAAAAASAAPGCTCTDGGADDPDAGVVDGPVWPNDPPLPPDAARPPDAPPGPPGTPFRFGINLGYPNPSWGDDVLATLAGFAGVNSLRVSLPESHLDRWGYEIEVPDMQTYAGLGLRDHVAFLGTPTAEHSTAPAGTPDWQRAYYIPTGLHEPVTLPGGDINPANPWGHYVYRTVATYKPWVGTWEVWNEPDWVSDWSVTQEWATRAPAAEDLPRFGGSIHDYVRMLRVTREAARLADPDARIATGGLGYPTFLAALVRYTDNPVDGSVTADYPETGDAYFDVVSFHYYPLYTAGNSDAAAAGYLALLEEMAGVLDAAGVTGKAFVTTESGAPHRTVGSWPSGPEYARNYLLKAMTKASAAGVLGLDWFALSDGAPATDPTDPYDHMGLYEDLGPLTNPADAVLTVAGTAYRTLGGALGDAVFDAATTAALALPAGADGAAFRLPDWRLALVLWATAADGEAASLTVGVPAPGPMRRYAWDASRTGASTLLTPEGGAVGVELESAPVVVIEEP